MIFSNRNRNFTVDIAAHSVWRVWRMWQVQHHQAPADHVNTFLSWVQHCEFGPAMRWDQLAWFKLEGKHMPLDKWFADPQCQLPPSAQSIMLLIWEPQ